MSVQAELTLRDGRLRYVTVMFPNSAVWAEQYRSDPQVVHVRQLPEHIERRAGGWFATNDHDGAGWSGPWETEAAAVLARDGKYDEAHAAGGLALGRRT